MTAPEAAYCSQCHRRCADDRIYQDPVVSLRQEQNISPCCGARLIDRRAALIRYLVRRLNRHFVHRHKTIFTPAALTALRAARRAP